MSQPHTSHQAKKYLKNDHILPKLLSDSLPDVPDDILSENECESGNDNSVHKIKIVDQEQSSSDTDKTSNEGATSWVKEDKTPKLGAFTGNPGVKQILCDPTKVSDTMELFFRDSFFELLCKETNQYYY
jgi:hypothetical protein